MVPPRVVLILNRVSPAFTIIAAGSLCMVGAVSNFAGPALPSPPVRMGTLLRRRLRNVQGGRGRPWLSRIVISTPFPWRGNRAMSGRRAHATITDKGGQARQFDLCPAGWPICPVAAAIQTCATVLPVIILIASSLAPAPSALFSYWTLHNWMGPQGNHIAHGTPGIRQVPDSTRATVVPLGPGVCVAIAPSIAPMPETTLLDEPLPNLDARLRVAMRTELMGLHRATTATALYVTHDQIRR